MLEIIEPLDLFKTSGADLHVFGDLIFVDEVYYSRFYKIEDAYDYYKTMQKVFNKTIIFMYKDEFYNVDENTTFNEIKEKYDNNNVVENKEEENNNINFKNLYINNLKRKDDSLYRLFYIKENNKVKRLER